MEKIILEKICVFVVARYQEQKLSNHPEIWLRCSYYISSDQVRWPKKSVYYEKRYLRLKIQKKNFESCFFREYLIYRLEILTSYCTNWRLYVVNISRDYLRFFRKKLFLKKLRFRCRTITRTIIIQSS